MIRRLSIIAVVLVAACSSESSDSNSARTSSAPLASSGALAIRNFKFEPQPFNAKVGDTVMVANEDGTDHSLTADDDSFDTGVYANVSKPITFTKAGSIEVHCEIHNFMTGVIQVAAS